jgi:hypothetical protein
MRILEAFSGIAQAWQTVSSLSPSAPPEPEMMSHWQLFLRACAGHGAVVDQAATGAEAVTLNRARDGVVALEDAAHRVASASMARKSMFLY